MSWSAQKSSLDPAAYHRGSFLLVVYVLEPDATVRVLRPAEERLAATAEELERLVELGHPNAAQWLESWEFSTAEVPQAARIHMAEHHQLVFGGISPDGRSHVALFHDPTFPEQKFDVLVRWTKWPPGAKDLMAVRKLGWDQFSNMSPVELRACLERDALDHTGNAQEAERYANRLREVGLDVEVVPSEDDDGG